MPEIALITGAAGALGSQLARTLAARGDKLVLVDVEAARPRLESVAKETGNAAIIAGDIALDATWKDGLPRVIRELGGAPTIAALIAGTWRGGKPLHEATDDETWRTVIDTNLETAHRSLRAILPAMVSAKRGSVVMIGARAAVQPWTAANSAAYATAKAGVVALAKAVAAETLEHGVRINAVLPSTMDTAANRKSMPNADPSKWVSLESAAGVIAFLLSDEARDISGAAVPVYGRS
ncbi:MAG TPA: SDR family NAD(P)-dependent oxidoreductase [Gemmatimonadales bacterium]|jgi:NAD(P)-dependent dehydrogenase (short-subunit alcohol dehydrogenase family)